MTNFIEDLSKKLGETVEQITSMAGSSVEVQKLKSQIRALERGNKHDLEDLGRSVYESFLAGNEMSDTIQEICNGIKGREESITDYMKKISDIKGENTCPNCGKNVTSGLPYCPYCGTKMPEPVEKESCDCCEEACDVVDSVKDEASDVVDSVKDVVSDAVDSVKDDVSDAVESVKDEVTDTVDKVEVEKDEVKDKAKEKASDALDKAHDLAKDATDIVKDVASKANETFNKVVDSISERVHKD